MQSKTCTFEADCVISKSLLFLHLLNPAECRCSRLTTLKPSFYAFSNIFKELISLIFFFIASRIEKYKHQYIVCHVVQTSLSKSLVKDAPSMTTPYYIQTQNISVNTNERVLNENLIVISAHRANTLKFFSPLLYYKVL